MWQRVCIGGLGLLGTLPHPKSKDENTLPTLLDSELGCPDPVSGFKPRAPPVGPCGGWRLAGAQEGDCRLQPVP